MNLSSSDFAQQIPNPAADFGTLPKDSATVGMVQNPAEDFRKLPQDAERKESHTLTVREVARMFEAAGVARTERSIINWCQPNRTGIARLDSYFDPNERRYFITLQSVEQAIAEENAKAGKGNEPLEPFRSIPQGADSTGNSKSPADDDEARVKELERENLDLRIANRGKDYLIEELNRERKSFFDQLLSANRKMGELETKLLQIEPLENSGNNVK